MNKKDDPELWDLLGKQNLVDPGPMFATNVLQRIHEEKIKQESSASWLKNLLTFKGPRPRWVIPAQACAALAILGLVCVFEFFPFKNSQTQAVVSNETSQLQNAEVWNESTAELFPEDTELLSKADSPDSLSDEQLLALLSY